MISENPEMGGSGSGRSSWRNAGTTDHALSLDVRVLKRAGALRFGASVTWQWTVTQLGDPTQCSVRLTCDRALTVAFTTDGESRREVITLLNQRQRLGGLRPWFRCPGCSTRVAKVYLSRGRFICRRCARLCYRSQRVGLGERGRLKIRKAYVALGLDPDEAEELDFVPRRAGMHWSTFNHHFAKLEAGAAMVDRDFIGSVEALSRRIYG